MRCHQVDDRQSERLVTAGVDKDRLGKTPSASENGPLRQSPGASTHDRLGRNSKVGQKPIQVLPGPMVATLCSQNWWARQNQGNGFTAMERAAICGLTAWSNWNRQCAETPVVKRATCLLNRYHQSTWKEFSAGTDRAQSGIRFHTYDRPQPVVQSTQA